jgi:sensor c-di-GMP phosphodiesterase-like protein
LELSHLALVLVYFAADYTQAWSSAVYTMILLLKVVTASILVRLTSEEVRKTQLDPTSQTVSNRSGQSATTAANSSKHDAPLQEKSADIESQADNDIERPTFEVTTVQHVHTLTFDERQERSRLASALGGGHYLEEDA